VTEERGGRPTVLSRAKHAVIVDAMRAGNFLETAAALAGIDSSTLRRWIRRGERERMRREAGQVAQSSENAFVRLALEVDLAAGAAQSEVVGRIIRAGQDDWRASAWWLERRHVDEWGPKGDDRRVARQLDGFLDQLRAQLGPEEFERVLRIATSEDE
jgi:transposase